MVKFKLSIFGSCRTKDLTTLTQQPCQRRMGITGSSFKSHNQSSSEDLQWHVVTKLYDVDLPRPKIYNSSTTLSTSHGDNRFCIPLESVPTFNDKKCRFSPNTDNHDEEEELQSKILTSSPRSFSSEWAQSQNDRREGEASSEWGSPARLSLFKELMPWKVEGKVKESFAVIKRSENPHEDFKKSMREMIIEKQMYEECDLKQLLQCFLSLNSRYHHSMIMEAFMDILGAMFLDQSTFDI